MEKVYKNCQSCGMPMKKDEKIAGTNKDGSKSNMYCSHCYQGGEFTQPNITVDGMQELVLGKMKEMHFPKFIGKMFTKKIPKLRRWKI